MAESKKQELERRKARIRADLREIIEQEAAHTREMMKRLAKVAERLGALTEEDLES